MTTLAPTGASSQCAFSGKLRSSNPHAARHSSAPRLAFHRSLLDRERVLLNTLVWNQAFILLCT